MNSTLPLVVDSRLAPDGLATAARLDDDQDIARHALAATFSEAPPLFREGRLRRAALLVGDLMGAVAVVFCVPFVILAVGTPIALCVRLLLWVGGWL